MITWPAPHVPRLASQGDDAPLTVYCSRTGTLVPVGGDGTLAIYACGITPYDATHLGHANTYLAFDSLQRVALDQGMTVKYLSNVTDIDDPLLERADATGMDWQELATSQIDLFRSDMEALQVLPPTQWTAVTDAIPAVSLAVARMLERGQAYFVEQDVYADLTADPAFGTFCGVDLSAPQTAQWFAERGGDPDRPGKRQPFDPLLWRAHREGEPFWDGGALGPGRPGWHIECSVIALAGHRGPLDVLGGGSDLYFPHHEMSASHSRLLGSDESPPIDEAPRVPMHAGMLAYEGHKMSKSRGNLVFVSRLLADGVPAGAIRLALLGHHYREDWEWTDAELERGLEQHALWTERIGAPGPVADGAEASSPLIAELRRLLANDLDTPAALRAIDETVVAHPDLPEAERKALREAINALLGVALWSARS